MKKYWNNKKWFFMVYALVLISMMTFAIVITHSIYVNRYEHDNRIYRTRIADDIITDSLEQIKWKFLTITNQDRINGWQNYIYPISWDYSIEYENNEYILKKADLSKVEFDGFIYREFDRKITITDNKWNPNEKLINIVIFDWEEELISKEFILTNVW